MYCPDGNFNCNLCYCRRFMATAINDFIQGIIMLAGIIAIIVAVLHSKGGFMAALDGLGHVSD